MARRTYKRKRFFNRNAYSSAPRRKTYRKDRLTGGTKDVNPQMFSGSVEAATTAAASTGFTMPYPKVSAQYGATVIEVLKVWFDTSATEGQIGTITLSTIDYGTVATTLANAGVITRYAQNTAKNMNKEVDLTDGAGHGVLVASDKLFCQYYNTNGGATFLGYFRVLYRFKRVSTSEYIGIVQSQQQLS